MRYKKIENLIKNLLNNHTFSTDEEFAKTCTQVILDFHPELKLRWARIYGRRWSYLYGNSSEISLDFKRIRLNDDYGICIDNSEVLPPEELEELTTILEKCFAGKTTL